MPSHVKPHEPDQESRLRPSPDQGQVRRALAGVLENRHFRTSRQCSDLLTYIVEHSLRDDASALKERVVGSQVFHRNPDYDTSEDPVVRVRAADVRKRLAQYYQDQPPEQAPVQIDLLPGSYLATFQSRMPRLGKTETAEEPSTPATAYHPPAQIQPEPVPSEGHRRRSGWVWILLAVAAATLLAAVFLWTQLRVSTAERHFWAPVTQADRPTLIYLGSNVAYRFTDAFMQHYRATHNVQQNGPEFFVDLPPNSTLHPNDLAPARSTFVTTGDLTAAVETTNLLSKWKREYVLRVGDDVSFGDLRNHPLVLIGAFNNPWTLEVTGDLPFSFHDGTRIEDKAHNRSWERPKELTPTTTDYALISRVLHAKTGGPVITIAGIGEFGTQAAAEFLANPDRVRDLVKAAPSGWENKNMQAVLRIRVVDYEPVGVDVIATRYW